MTRQPAATIKSHAYESGRRRWYARCLLHPQPVMIGMFGAPVSWMFAECETRKSALAVLGLHQRKAHPCAGCAGLDCPRCKGTGVDLTTMKD